MKIKIKPEHFNELTVTGDRGDVVNIAQGPETQPRAVVFFTKADAPALAEAILKVAGQEGERP